MKQNVMIFTVLLIFLTSLTASAEDRWSAEIRGGISSATQELGDSELEQGAGFEATVAFSLAPHLDAYAGWGWNQFKSEKTSSQPELTFEETGYTFGLQFIHPIGDSAISYLIRCGGVFNHLELEDSDGEIIEDSGHGLGWQLGAGLEIALSDSWQLHPTARYRALSTEMEIEGEQTELDLTYTSIGIGLAHAF